MYIKDYYGDKSGLDMLYERTSDEERAAWNWVCLFYGVEVGYDLMVKWGY